MRHTVVLFALVCCMGATSASAQAHKMQQSQNVQQPGEASQDVQQYLAMLEWQPTAPQAVSPSATGAQEQASQASTPSPADATPSPSQTSSSGSEKTKVVLVSGGPDDKSSPPPAPSKDSSESTTKPSSAPPATGDDDKSKVRLDIYGFAMLDMGFDFNQNDPLWFDVMRPTKLPSSPDQFGKDGNFYSGVRQTRFGVKGYFQTP